jgi:hypothetical protein
MRPQLAFRTDYDRAQKNPPREVNGAGEDSVKVEKEFLDVDFITIRPISSGENHPPDPAAANRFLNNSARPVRCE